MTEERYVLKEKKVEVTKYVTTDGKEFFYREDAIKHQSQITDKMFENRTKAIQYYTNIFEESLVNLIKKDPAILKEDYFALISIVLSNIDRQIITYSDSAGRVSSLYYRECLEDFNEVIFKQIVLTEYKELSVNEEALKIILHFCNADLFDFYDNYDDDYVDLDLFRKSLNEFVELKKIWKN
jgi:hypothetical protein